MNNVNINDNNENKVPGRDILPSEREAYWKEQVLQKQNSGLTIAAYCRLHGLSCDQFSYWERKLRKGVKPSSLLPVTLSSSKISASCLNLPIVCSVTLKSGAELKLYDIQLLPSLLSILG